MQFAQLGNSGLTVSRICLGLMSYGSSKWRPWVLDEPAARPFYRKALDLGINFFDTADMYSMGVSEEVTGRALREMANMEEIVLATKVHFPMGDGPNIRQGRLFGTSGFDLRRADRSRTWKCIPAGSLVPFPADPVAIHTGMSPERMTGYRGVSRRLLGAIGWKSPRCGGSK